MQNTYKIFAVFFLLGVIIILLILSISLENKNNYALEVINISNNNHLAQDEYYSYANLKDRKEYEKLSIQIIKDRLEKHPYVGQADVRYDGSGNVSVILTEKKFSALLLDNGDQYFITDDFEVVSFLPFTKQVDYPVITNLGLPVDIKFVKKLNNYESIKTAFKILLAINLLDPELYENFSEIDLRNGGDIILQFSLINYPVVLGKGREIEKIIYFSNLWNSLKGKQINNFMDYIDLRYEKLIYLGLSGDMQEGINS